MRASLELLRSLRGTRRIEGELARIADDLGDELSEFCDRHLLAAADIDMPVPHTFTLAAFSCFDWWKRRISAGTTWLFSG
jgi:hypothetical protein